MKMMKRTRITVIRMTYIEDLLAEYGGESLKPRPRHEVGEVFYADHRKPDRFGDDARKAMQHHVFACCQDGFRPATFKTEATDGTSKTGGPKL